MSLDGEYRKQVSKDKKMIALHDLDSVLANMKQTGGRENIYRYRDGGIDNLVVLYGYLKSRIDKYDIVELECKKEPERRFLGFKVRDEHIVCIYVKFKTGRIGKFYSGWLAPD